jgi:hypothetical protein
MMRLEHVHCDHTRVEEGEGLGDAEGLGEAHVGDADVGDDVAAFERFGFEHAEGVEGEEVEGVWEDELMKEVEDGE